MLRISAIGEFGGLRRRCAGLTFGVTGALQLLEITSSMRLPAPIRAVALKPVDAETGPLH